ncbi:hypothetical protein D9M68_710470 [compost metagenome]
MPTVTAAWFGVIKAWPIIGPRHNAAHCLEFENHHFHLDARFIYSRSDDRFFWRSVMSSPLQTSDKVNPDGLPAPVWRRRLCRRLVNPVQDAILEDLARKSNRQWICHQAQWAGKQARRDARGWICPHRNVSMGGQPVVDGVIVCPLHLLPIDAETGVVLPLRCGGGAE